MSDINLPIYLDYSATTPVDPRVADKMRQFLTPDGEFGNPASRSHSFGWHAEEAVDEARKQVAALIGADPREIVWTSGGTESDNLAIKGAAHFYQKKGKHIVTVKTEHKAVLDTCPATGAGRFRSDLPGTAGGRPARPGRTGSFAARRHGAGVGDARQQRNRRRPRISVRSAR